MQHDFYQEIKALILDESLSNEELIQELENYHSSDIADVAQELTKEQRLSLYKKIGIEKTSEIFEFYQDVEKYIDELQPEMAADVVEKMDSDDAVGVLNELEDDDKKEIIQLMEPESKNEVLKLDKYDDDVIGSYMTDNFIVLNINDTIPHATSKTIKEAGEHDNIFTLYVVDDDGKYCGAVNIKDLFVARKTDVLKDLVMESYPYFIDTELMSDCINRLKDYSEDSVPVLNSSMHIVGVITSDAVIEATEDEMNEDYAKLAGLSEEEDVDESVLISIKKRIPWLIILLVLGLVVSTVTGSFEGVIATIPVVVFFQSMVLDMAGNVGTQSLAVTIRNLANGESKKKLFKGILKEVGVGIINGIIVASIAFIFVVSYLCITKQEIISGNSFNIHDTLKVSGIIAISMLVSMAVSNLVGSIFPFILNKIHIDPAVASGPFITTINDIISIVIYYGLTWILFIAI